MSEFFTEPCSSNEEPYCVNRGNISYPFQLENRVVRVIRINSESLIKFERPVQVFLFSILMIDADAFSTFSLYRKVKLSRLPLTRLSISSGLRWSSRTSCGR